MIDVIIPVLIILLAGYLFGKFSKIDPSPISKLSIFLLSPALIFSFLVKNELSSTEMIQITTSVLLFTIVMVLLTVIVMRWTGNKEFTNASLLSTVFPNTGNYGLPIILFAFGEKASAMAIIIVVMNFILMYSLGIYFASYKKNSWKTALKSLFFLPTTYATILAIIVNLFHIKIPDFIMDPISMVGEVMIPLALILLGIQLSRSSLKGYISVTILSSVLKIVLAPLVIFVIVQLMGISGILAKVLIIQHSMPTAVIMTIIAAEYKTKADTVANITFMSTVASFISVTILLYFLNAYYG
ncbi:AEC family transporter [Neobacillus sp. Marseille-QA0830]